MAMSDGNHDCAVLSNGGVAASAASASPVPACDGDLATPQLTPKEAPKAKASPNGCLQANGAVKPPVPPSDSHRAPPTLAPCCRPCPYHRPLSSHHGPRERHPEAGPAAASALAACCAQPRPEYPAPLCPHHAPVYRAAFCLHRPWPGHFQHQPVPQHVASVR